MSRENVELVRRALSIWEGEVELGESLALFDENVVTRRVAPMPDPRSASGREGLLSIVLEWVEGFDDFEMRGSEYTDAGDFVVARIEQRARGELSGAPVEATYWFVFELSRGAIIRMDMFQTREQAQAAAGI